MLLRRVIPCLDVDKGRVVKGVEFVNLRDAGDPVELAVRYQEAGADEIVFLDITASHEKRDTVAALARRCADDVFVPVHDRRRRPLARRRPCGARRRGREGVRELGRGGAARAARRAGGGVRRPVRGARDRRPRRGRELRRVRERRAHARGPRRGRVGARGRGARSGGDTPHEHGPRRHRGRLRAAAHAGGGRRGGRARDRLGRRRHARPPRRGGGATGGADAVLCASIFHYGTYSVREAKEHMRRAGVPVRL